MTRSADEAERGNASPATLAAARRKRRNAAALAGSALLAVALLLDSVQGVTDGSALLISRFGQTARVVSTAGAAWHLPAPLEIGQSVDLRLHVTSGALRQAGTKDGVPVLAQLYLAWQVSADAAAVSLFARAVGNDPAEAARQVEGLAGAALQAVIGSYVFADLVNADPARLRLEEVETRILARIAPTVLATYGIAIRQVGIEGLTLPEAALAAGAARLRSERQGVAAHLTAEGAREAAQIRDDSERDSRILIADARRQAAETEAEARRQAAEIEGRAYLADPQLYTMLRSLDSLATVIGPNTRLVLRTDAAPFNALVQGPPTESGGK